MDLKEPLGVCQIDKESKAERTMWKCMPIKNMLSLRNLKWPTVIRNWDASEGKKWGNIKIRGASLESVGRVSICHAHKHELKDT